MRQAKLRILEDETAKDLYYRGRRDDRFRPILIEFPEMSRPCRPQWWPGFLAGRSRYRRVDA